MPEETRGPIRVKHILEYKNRAEVAEEQLQELELKIIFVRDHLTALTSNPRIRHNDPAMMVIEDMRKLLKDPIS